MLLTKAKACCSNLIELSSVRTGECVCVGFVLIRQSTDEIKVAHKFKQIYKFIRIIKVEKQTGRQSTNPWGAFDMRHIDVDESDDVVFFSFGFCFVYVCVCMCVQSGWCVYNFFHSFLVLGSLYHFANNNFAKQFGIGAEMESAVW